jgi:hypothetical protein
VPATTTASHPARPAPKAPNEQQPSTAPALEAAADERGIELVTVHVTTQPPGASVRVAGGGEVCARTPCSFDAVRGAPISLQARRSGREALATLSPTSATELHLVLTGAAPRSAGAQDDLKVPEIFRTPSKQ